MLKGDAHHANDRTGELRIYRLLNYQLLSATAYQTVPALITA
jgi:hypothetical protein